MTFELRVEHQERSCYRKKWGKTILGRENRNNDKPVMRVMRLACLRDAKGNVPAEQ